MVDVTLPKGLTGKLAGIPYCSEAAIAAAGGKSGNAEQANPSCSASSLLGTATTDSGTGANPLQTRRQASTSPVPTRARRSRWSSITPAVAGPFDLGTVVVRVALNVNPETAQINAVSDLIPDVFGGVEAGHPLDRRQRRSQQVHAQPDQLRRPGDHRGAQRRRREPDQPGRVQLLRRQRTRSRRRGCNKLAFKPKLKIQLYGPTKRAKNPRLGDPRSPRRRRQHRPHGADAAALAVPRPEPHRHRLHEAAAGRAAPARRPRSTGRRKRSRRCSTDKLKGPVYLVSSNNKLPDLVADLRGQVNIQLRGVISSKHRAA